MKGIEPGIESIEFDINRIQPKTKSIPPDVREILEQRDLAQNVSRKYIYLKRMLDIFFSLAGLIVLLPAFIAIAAMLWFDSPGPVFLSEYMYGWKGKVFKLYRFRSVTICKKQRHRGLADGKMFDGGKPENGIVHRIQKVSEWIGKSGVGKLPQLLNVLKNEMSFVGPGPLPVSHTDSYQTWYHLRLSVKPGITGLWQVCKTGCSDISGIDEMVRMDFKYIRERNLWYDCKIIFRTVPVMIRAVKKSLGKELP